ncbi:MAG: PBP1A family penicillin-binding protein [Alphaproteobacteria bacterium]|nr:PBP1A family penicillin-binding protein [Alphaproteobacteria bacterium]
MTSASNGKPGLKKPVSNLPSISQRVRKLAGKPRPILKWSLIALTTVAAVGALSGYLFWQSLYRDMPELPSKEALWSANREAAIEFLDKDGNTLEIRGPRYGRAVTLDELPPHVPRAFIAAEDKRFYLHDGADTQAIVRAAFSNLTSGKTVSGASTLTQQLIKNLVLSPEQTLKRKVQEVRLARQLEERMTKSEILELYLNRVYFGSGFYGLGAASRFYFDKEPRDLTLAEASLLATLPKAPSRFALDDNMEGAKERQAYVLREMVDAGFITRESARIAAESDVKIAPEPVRDPQFGYILDAATERVNTLLPELPDDLVVTLTIDTPLQKEIGAMIEQHLSEQGEALNTSQASAIVMDRNGHVLALYAGRDYLENQFNRVTQARRQPGSAFKPFVYAAALNQGMSPYDVRIDQPVTIDDWTPKNFTRVHMGPVTLSEALRDSLNTISALLGQEVGEEAIIALANKFGIASDMEPFPSIALGSQEVTLWELTRAYGPFMTGGLRVDPYLVERIENSRGKVLYERKTYEAPRVYPRDNAEMMTAMLAQVVSDGTGRNAQVPGWAVAGKTGTSQSSRDAWFIGYSAEILAGVWTGNDDDTSMKRVTGGGFPAEIWSDVMTLAHAGRQPSTLRGADTLHQLSPQQQARVGYYRDLGMAFSEVLAN